MACPTLASISNSGIMRNEETDLSTTSPIRLVEEHRKKFINNPKVPGLLLAG